MAKHINRGWATSLENAAQPIGITFGDRFRQNAEPTKLTDEQKRLVAEIKRHHPQATTEGILKHLEAWGE